MVFPVFLFCDISKEKEIIEELNKLKDPKIHYQLKEWINFWMWFDPRIVPPKRKDLKVFSNNMYNKVLIHKTTNDLYVEDSKTQDIVWKNAKYLENCWWDIEHDFIFFVDNEISLDTNGVKKRFEKIINEYQNIEMYNQLAQEDLLEWEQNVFKDKKE
jgi:hypothetical protein